MVIIFSLAISAVTIYSQIASGGSYALTQAVVSSGGGQSSGGTFGITGTTGQQAAGTTSAGGPFDVHGGFWQGDLSPTAAGVSISGRVLTPDGSGLRNAIVYLTDRTGSTRMTLTGSFGYYRFDEIEAGQTVILSVHSKQFHFTPQLVNLTDNSADIDIISSEPNRQ